MKKQFKNKFKLTKEIHDEIKTVSLVLPKIIQEEGGKPMMRTINQRIKGSDLSEKHRLQIKNFDPNEIYTVTAKEPVLVNHEISLIQCYKKFGKEGITQYCAEIKKAEALAIQEGRTY